MVKKSPENTTPAIVDNVEALEAKLAQMREAQALFATYTQEQVDKIFYEAAMAANKARIPLAKMAIEETGRGVLEDKVIKNHYAAEYIYNAYKNTKTCGVLERDEAYGITKIAEPIGIVGAVIPTTNPTSTAIFKTLISLKTRNAIIISPHPAAAKCTIAAAKLVLDAAVIRGMAAGKIAELAGIEVPAMTKILIAEVTSTDPAKEEFSHEKLSPVLAMYHAKDFQEAVDKAEHLVLAGGPGHTASLYVHPAQAEKISLFEHVMKACRIVINTPSSHGGIGDLYNFGMKPSLTLGCGSWGGNSVSENVGVKHLINVKTVAERRENMLWFRAPEKVYFKKGSTPVALDELGNVMGKKRAFIVTDQFLFKNGNTRAIEAKLDEMGIAHDCFYDVEPDPSLQCARRGAKQMALFEPDVIIAVGGGSAMDAGKIMWMMYEHPECKFEDMAMDFMDIRKRIFTFPEMGKKAYFVAVPTSSGTGSECTPFAIITDKETGIKWPLADYALLPNMAIVDADNCMTAPRGLTAASGIDVMTHAIESYVSIMASDYTKGLSERAAKLVFENLPSSFTNGAKDPHAREEMHNASCMAGMAFANAFLGLNHSMAHKLGAFHHLPHGIANAVILTRVMRYNAAEAPVKMGTFSQYPYPNALHNYAEMAKYCGIEGKDDKEVFENFITKLEELKDFIGVKKTIADYGVDEQYFLDTLDEMTEQAFNDQCTGANPRYPLMSEIKELYLDAYYGREPQDYAVC